jgi:hypothetical protein
MTKRTNDENTSLVTAFIDRLEEGVAVISLSAAPETYFNLPLQYLPPNVAEGDHLKLTFELDAESKEATRNRIAALQAELATEPEMNIKL